MQEQTLTIPYSLRSAVSSVKYLHARLRIAEEALRANSDNSDRVSEYLRLHAECLQAIQRINDDESVTVKDGTYAKTAAVTFAADAVVTEDSVVFLKNAILTHFSVDCITEALAFVKEVNQLLNLEISDPLFLEDAIAANAYYMKKHADEIREKDSTSKHSKKVLLYRKEWDKAFGTFTVSIFGIYSSLEEAISSARSHNRGVWRDSDGTPLDFVFPENEDELITEHIVLSSSYCYDYPISLFLHVPNEHLCSFAVHELGRLCELDED